MRRLGLIAAGAVGLWSVVAAAAERDVKARVDEKMYRFQQCWDEAVDRKPDRRGGRIVTVFVVEKDGEVSSARVSENQMGDEVLAACVRDVFLSLEHDKADERATITYPLTFD